MAQETTSGLPKANKDRQPNKDKGCGICKEEILKFPQNLTDQESSIGNSEINQIFETAADGMRVIDKDFNVIRVNTTFCDLAGITAGEALGMKCHEVFCGPMCHTFECSLTQILNGKERIECDVEKVHRDGYKIPCILTATPLRNFSGDIIAIVEDFKDIRERKKLENDLLKAKNALEFQVEERTKELNQTIKKMQKEITERKKTERALEKTKKELSILSSNLLQTLEDERRQIAFELYDTLIQSLAGIKYTLEIVMGQNRKKRISADERLIKIVGMIKNLIQEVLEITMRLWPSNLEDLGLFAAVSNFCREFELKYSRIHIKMQTTLQEKDIPDFIKIVIFRIIQEAVSNAVEQSNCNKVLLTLNKKNNRISLYVEDDGIGLNEFRNNDKKGLGLLMIKERAELSDGAISIKSVKGGGTIIQASWAGSVVRKAFEACPAVVKTPVSLGAPHKHYSLKGE